MAQQISVNSATGNIQIQISRGAIGPSTTANVANTALNLNAASTANVIIGGGVANYVLSTDGAGNTSWVAQTGGGATNPAGANTQVQFNDQGSFGAESTFTYDKTTDVLTVDHFSGEAGNLSNIQGANVSGEVSFAATANAVAYANVSGTPTLGNISTINIDGNVANVLRGDGSFAADANSSYGDSNVVTLLGAFGSNTITTTGSVDTGNLAVNGINGNITFTPDTTSINGEQFTMVTLVDADLNDSGTAVIADNFTGGAFDKYVLWANTAAGNLAEGPRISKQITDAIGNTTTDPYVPSIIKFNIPTPTSNLASTSTETHTSLQMGTGAGGWFTLVTGSDLGTSFGRASWQQFQYQPGAMSFWRRNGNGDARTGTVANDKSTIEFIMASNNGSGSTSWSSYPSHIAGKVDASFGGGVNAVVPTGLEYQVADSIETRRYHDMYANGDTTFNSSGVDVSGNPISTNPITLGFNGIITGDGANISNINGANVIGLSTSSISNGTSNVDIATSGGNIAMSVGGANVAVFSTTGAVYPGVLSVNGNITAKNDITAEAGANFIGSASLDVLKVSSNNISIGYRAGDTSQGADSVAIGKDAGRENQSGFAIAIGNSAGNLNQGSEGVAIGHNSGVTTQGIFAVAVGPSAGQTTQGSSAVAVGFGAGFNNQGTLGVGIGHNAGEQNQGVRAVAIGPYAGVLNQHDSSIVINATSANLNSPDIATFTVKPIRNGGSSGSLPAGFVQMAYNPTTGEIVYYT